MSLELMKKGQKGKRKKKLLNRKSIEELRRGEKRCNPEISRNEESELKQKRKEKYERDIEGKQKK